jgi:hypothetical protein
VRKFALVLIAGILGGVAATVALAGPVTSRVTLARPAALARAAALAPASPGQPRGVRLAASFGYQGLSPAEQPMLTELDVWFPKGSLYNGGRYPTCSAHILSAFGPTRCPKGSIMGSGGGNAFADQVITHPKITIVNGGPNLVYFYTVLNNPARVEDPVPGRITRLRGNYTYHLHVTIPQDLRVVAGVPIKVTLLHIVAGHAKWLALTAAPAGVKVLTTFDNGAKISAQVWLQNT